MLGHAVLNLDRELLSIFPDVDPFYCADRDEAEMVEFFYLFCEELAGLPEHEKENPIKISNRDGLN